ncbi:MAG: GDSL-type esterase/lipase family protein [Roseimicrobium sp.]
MRTFSTWTRLALLPALLAVSCTFAETKRPDPARFAKDIAKFDAEDAAKPKAQGGIVFTGSSSIRKWPVQEAFPDLPVLNRGFGGSVANDLVVYAEKLALRYAPKLLVVYTGGNDLHAKLSPVDVLADYTKFLSLVHERLPSTRVLVQAVRTGPVRLAELELAEKLNGLLKGWCQDKPWIRWCEVPATLVKAGNAPRDEFYLKDRLHLNADGYKLWAADLGPALREEWRAVNR